MCLHAFFSILASSCMYCRNNNTSLHATRVCREWMLGGNYTALALALEDYITRLRDGGVELLVALDPAHGTEEVKKGPPNACKETY
jgi:hypothetical protein